MAYYYPSNLAARVTWHANFATEAAASGATVGLTAGPLAQIPIDADTVALLVNYWEAIDAFRQEVTEYRDLILSGPSGTPLPPAPVVPPAPTLDPGALASIELRTQGYVNTIKGSANFTPAIGEAYQIVSTTPAVGTPSIRATPEAGTSNVALKVSFNGHSLVAIDLSVAGGAWVEIERVNKANYVDTTAAAVPNQPEQRSYRVQGVVDNVRSGPLSDVVTVVTTC